MQGVIERVASEPAKGDTAIMTAGRVRYTVKDVPSEEKVVADREETFRGRKEGESGFTKVETVSFSPLGWRDLVTYGACTVEVGQDAPKQRDPGGFLDRAPLPETKPAAKEEKKGLFGKLFG